MVFAERGIIHLEDRIRLDIFLAAAKLWGLCWKPLELRSYTQSLTLEFDEPGQELGRDAQVWKTYVKEADMMDSERVDGWKQTSDVILIFAALFSAISTAFVIESYKSLKPDPADISVEILRAMSRNLVSMSNQSQDVLDHPFAQARRREQRWDGLVKWKMEEVLTFLPSLIHLALLLFAIGLSIFLWDLHLLVAIPVTFVAGIGILIYIGCTVAPFIDTYCPYGTTLSRMYQQLFAIKLQPSQDDPDLDTVTSRAIEWMLNHCETPRSVEVAFQSTAGITSNFDLSRIEKCEAWHLKLESDYQQSTENEVLDAMIWAIQARIDRLNSNSSDLRRTSTPTYAVISQTAHYCIKGIHHGQKSQTDNSEEARPPIKYKESFCNFSPVEEVTSLLERHLNNTDTNSFSMATFEALCTSFTLLLCCSLIHCSPSTAVKYLLRILKTSRGPESVEVRLAMTVFIFSRHDFPGWSQPTRENVHLKSIIITKRSSLSKAR
ncbi:hypothetical protein OPQ81_001149 [Rhizoctonia solani]|nr:hypothetical protein OPQ81_001149 [Rhizoctonia solani]